MYRTATIVAALLFWALPAAANVRLPAVIGDNMVLQADVPLTIWGKADAGEAVTVRIAGQSVSATADKDGKWAVKLQPIATSDKTLEMTASGNNEIKVKNILVGQVWLASGQSNMAWPVRLSATAKEASAEGDLPGIRVFTTANVSTSQPAEEASGAWVVTTPETVEKFTATGFYFAREIHKTLKQPVGIVCSAWGGSAIGPWTPHEACDDAALPLTRLRLAALTKNYPEGMRSYENSRPAWQATTQAMTATRPALATQPRELPPAPRPPQAAREYYGGMYNGMIAPFSQYAFRGALWYQGESNAGQPAEYQELLPTMIGAWRKNLNNPDMPFLVVQLPNFMARRDDPNAPSGWAAIREVQAKALAVKNVGVAVTIDIGEANNIHPKDKLTVGKRLALLALAKVYGKDVAADSPMFDSMKIDGDAVRVKFKNAEGLAARGESVKGFAVAGEDGKYHWATARIDGDTVIVNSKQVDKPVSVRYAWGDNPECNLYNKAELPAMPFRAGEKTGG